MRSVCAIGGAPPTNRQRHPHRRYRCAGAEPTQKRGGQGWRCCAHHPCAGPAKAPAWPADAMTRVPTPRICARPIVGAPLGLRGAGAFIRWEWELPGLNDILAEFSSHSIGHEVEGRQSSGWGSVFPRPASPVYCASSAASTRFKWNDALTRGWPLERIEAILRAVLRAGAYELGYRSDVPARVSRSRSMSTSPNALVDEDETGMVDAVLDQLARRFQSSEFARRQVRATELIRRCCGTATIGQDSPNVRRLRSSRSARTAPPSRFLGQAEPPNDDGALLPQRVQSRG